MYVRCVWDSSAHRQFQMSLEWSLHGSACSFVVAGGCNRNVMSISIIRVVSHVANVLAFCYVRVLVNVSCIFPIFTGVLFALRHCG